MKRALMTVGFKTPFDATRRSGKVREMFDLGDGTILVASTDRISVFDGVLPQGIPHKGQVLNNISAFWFDLFADVVPNHMITIGQKKMPAVFRRPSMAGRVMLCRKADVLKIEGVARGFLYGSAWKEYKELDGPEKGATVCAEHKMPPGLKEADRLPEPIFTPTTKAEGGEHDEPITFEQMEGIVGAENAEAIRRLSIDLYNSAVEFAGARGVIVADSKFEWGMIDGKLVLIDELLTPDSSRFWPADQYKPGGKQPSFDKQPVRDWAADIGWDGKTQPAPSVPSEVIVATTKRYIECFQLLTGKRFAYAS